MAFLNPFKMHFRKNPNIPNDRPLSAENILFTFVFSVSNLTGDLVKNISQETVFPLKKFVFNRKCRIFIKILMELYVLQEKRHTYRTLIQTGRFPIGKISFLSAFKILLKFFFKKSYSNLNSHRKIFLFWKEISNILQEDCFSCWKK